MAVTDIGLTPREFWGLTWYEWGLYVLKLHKDSKQQLHDRELNIELARSFMALYANSIKGKNVKAFHPQDFFKLSYDTQLTEKIDPELFSKVAQRLGGSIKKKDSGDK